MMRFLTQTCRLRLPVTVVVVVVRLGALLVVVVAVPEAMLGSFAKAGHTMAIATTLATAWGGIKLFSFRGRRKMIYFHHHSPENTGRSSEKKSRHLYLARATGLSQLANSGSHSLEQVEFPAVKIVAT